MRELAATLDAIRLELARGYRPDGLEPLFQKASQRFGLIGNAPAAAACRSCAALCVADAKPTVERGQRLRSAKRLHDLVHGLRLTLFKLMLKASVAPLASAIAG